MAWVSGSSVCTGSRRRSTGGSCGRTSFRVPLKVLSSARVATLLSILALFTGIASSPSSTTQMSAAKKPLERAENDSPDQTRCSVPWFLSSALIGTFDDETNEKGCSLQELAAAALKLDGKSVETEGTQEVTAHAALDGAKGPTGLFDPLEGEGVGEPLEVGALVDVADAILRARLKQQNVLEQA